MKPRATTSYLNLRDGDEIILPATEECQEEMVTVVADPTSAPLEFNPRNGCHFLYAFNKAGEVMEIPVEDPEALVRRNS